MRGVRSWAKILFYIKCATHTVHISELTRYTVMSEEERISCRLRKTVILNEQICCCSSSCYSSTVFKIYMARVLLGFFFPATWMYLCCSNSTGTLFSGQQPGPTGTYEVYYRGRCLWLQLSCPMPPLARNIQINCYSNQPSFVTYRAVRFNEPVYSTCCKNSITLYSK